MPEFTITTQQESSDTPPITVGEAIVEKTKSPYTDAQNRAAGFAYRMVQANDIINGIEDSGFNPVNLRDFTLENFPLVGGSFITRFMMQPKYKQYGTAKVDFSTAQLRRETGAVINDSEIVWINQTYFPQVGDDEATLKIKEKNRSNAIAAMKSEAGAAYTKILENNPTDNAKKILEQRSESDPVLRQMLIEQGVISE
tara:strand:+ start:1027 stop:1620 length:594 start_codon:yes stop_codon:yes gene_type:complete